MSAICKGYVSYLPGDQAPRQPLEEIPLMGSPGPMLRSSELQQLTARLKTNLPLCRNEEVLKLAYAILTAPLYKSSKLMKISRKQHALPYSFNVNSKDVFIHLRGFLGSGFCKKTFSALRIQSRKRITPIVVQRLINSKSLDPCGSFTPERRFKCTQQEAAFQQTLQHPNIVRIIHSEIRNQQILIYAERCDSNLKETMQFFDFQSKLSLVLDYSRALAYLHSLGVSHNDIKLENLLVKNRCGKLSDFGLSKNISNELELGFAKTLAPEQRVSIKQKEPTFGTSMSDVYQFGLVCWHLFHPAPPANHLQDNFIYPADFFSNWVSSNPSEEFVQNLIRSCLEKEPAARISMESIKNQLDNYFTPVNRSPKNRNYREKVPGQSPGPESNRMPT